MPSDDIRKKAIRRRLGDRGPFRGMSSSSRTAVAEAEAPSAFESFEYAFNYWDGKSTPIGYMLNSMKPPGHKPREHAKMTFELNDMRALPNQSVDTNGFQLVTHNTSLAPEEFYEAAKVTGSYYQEMERLILDQVAGAKRVVIYDHNVRHAEYIVGSEKRKQADAESQKLRYSGDGQTGKETKLTPLGPVKAAHNDFTHRSGPFRLHAMAKGRGEGGSYTLDSPLLSQTEVEELEQKRFAIIQVWRPINKPIVDFPLAVCDATTLPQSDLKQSQLVYPDRVGLTYTIRPNADHKWYVCKEMNRQEAMIFKCYDTQLDGRARFTAHSAIELPNIPEDAPPRESIEIRALVFFDEERVPAAGPEYEAADPDEPAQTPRTTPARL